MRSSSSSENGGDEVSRVGSEECHVESTFEVPRGVLTELMSRCVSSNSNNGQYVTSPARAQWWFSNSLPVIRYYNHETFLVDVENRAWFFSGRTGKLTEEFLIQMVVVSNLSCQGRGAPLALILTLRPQSLRASERCQEMSYL